MRELRVLFHLTKFGIRGLLRNQRVLVFTIAFPIILLVLFNSIFAHGRDTTTLTRGVELDEDAYFTAGILAYSIMLSAFSTMAIGLVAQRESGQLKRLRGTPLPPWVFMVAQVMRAIILISFMAAVLLLIGHFAYDVHFPSDTFGGFILYIVLGTATMCILGIALTAVASTAEAASTIAPFSAVLCRAGCRRSAASSRSPVLPTASRPRSRPRPPAAACRAPTSACSACGRSAA